MFIIRRLRKVTTGVGSVVPISHFDATCF
jgi:hypothetical protein